MATTQAQASFRIIATMDGTSLYGYLRAERTALVQYYNTETGAYAPDFGALAADKKPLVALILMNVSTGALAVPTEVTWQYNGVTLTFGSNNLSTNSGMEGLFKRIASYSTTYDGKSVSVPALEIEDNLASVGNVDNDRISCSGKIEVGGNDVDFNDISKEIVIAEAQGTGYVIILGNAEIHEGDSGAQLTAELLSAGAEVADLSGITFRWTALKAEGDKVLSGSGKTVTVSADDVDWQLVVKCEALQNGAVIAAQQCTVTDLSDPVQATVGVTGIDGEYIRPGETARVTPSAKRRVAQTAVTVSSWTWRTTDNAGAAFSLSGKGSATFTAGYADITYEDVINADGCVNGYVSAEVNI